MLIFNDVCSLLFFKIPVLSIVGLECIESSKCCICSVG